MVLQPGFGEGEGAAEDKGGGVGEGNVGQGDGAEGGEEEGGGGDGAGVEVAVPVLGDMVTTH